MVDRGVWWGGSGDMSGVEVPPLPALTLSQLVTGGCLLAPRCNVGRCGLVAGEIWASDNISVGVAQGFPEGPVSLLAAKGLLRCLDTAGPLQTQVAPLLWPVHFAASWEDVKLILARMRPDEIESRSCRAPPLVFYPS
jgi:hypothetical protein